MSNYNLFLLSLFLCFITLNAHSHREHRCSHDEEQTEPGLIDVDEVLHEDEDGRGLSGAPRMRIYPHFDTLQGGSSEFRSYVRYDLIPPVLDYYESVLKVRYPLRSPLKVDKSVKTLCDYKTPSILLTTGVEADHFMYFIVDTSSSRFVATSMYCHISSGIKRPIISRVKFNTGGLKLPRGDALEHEANTYVLLHEVMHSFGFSSTLFPYFLDENGNTRKGHVRKVNIAGATRQVLDIPALTSKVRRHFGCSSLPGIILENNGDAGMTAGSHFERRYFLLDLMTSGMLHGRRVSEFSLGVLEGSGWYQVDYDYAEPNSFGAGQGCDFIYNTCSNVKQFDEFCSKSGEKGCFASGRGGGKCSSDKNADGCKFHDPSLSYDCENPGAARKSRLANLQTYGRGAGSKCFEGTLSNQKNDVQNTFCFKFSCSGSGSGTRLYINVGSNQVQCNKAGYVEVPGYEGAIKCPDPSYFCYDVAVKYCPRGCMGRGSCVKNKCVCSGGYKGVDCGLR